MQMRRVVPTLFVAVLISGCASEPYSGRTPLIVAHRGASHLAPENTMSAFNLAWELDADLVEGDFYLTKDGVIICHHDGTTKKTAGVDRPVEEQTLAELKRLDVGKWKHSKWEGERMPTLLEVLKTVPDGKTFLIEIKSDERIVPTLIEEMDASGLGLDQMTVICFDEAVIEAIEQSRPEIKTFWLSSFDDDTDEWLPTVAELLETAERIGTDGLDLNANMAVIDESFVSSVRAEDLELHVWTVNDPGKAKRLAGLGVDSITTDRPGWMREQVTRR